jgi:tripartite-type tricarboxylate transporter receptor subunit TctC
MQMMRILLVAVFALVGLAQAHAQANYPNKPMRWVVPYAAGGGADVIARPIAIRLSEALGQPVVYDNRAGGGGLIGAEFVARSAPDGYTFLVAAGNTHVFATLLNDKIAYDPVKDFAPITKFDTTPNVLVANAAFPPKTIKELPLTAKRILARSSGPLQEVAPVATSPLFSSPKRPASRSCMCRTRGPALRRRERWQVKTN